MAGVLRSLEDPRNVPKKPYKRSGRVSEPQSVKLEGEKSEYPSCDDIPTTSDQTDTAGPLRRHEDVRDIPNELLNVSELERKKSELSEEVNSQESAQIEPDEPGRELVAQSDSYSIQEGHTSIRNERRDRTNAPDGHRSELSEEVNRRHQESSRTSRTAKPLSKAANTMG
ncbi:hypothetical protein L210DRAFT_3072925 [Boletus edulis BED1]|uniref:Uncharacterized protein n=1 Tax=Boletus edulis BED1 TaxID=1328754 RepID=A0AAD4BHJ8_BOLED|nr:hypothetical protein L210DRAFT_3072925 [Boletus edulis BED1]